jgi:hypothetical protein
LYRSKSWTYTCVLRPFLLVPVHTMDLYEHYSSGKSRTRFRFYIFGFRTIRMISEMM